MIKFAHTVELVTEVDENHSVGRQLLALPDSVRSKMLVDAFEGVLKDEGFLDKINAGSSYAVVKLAKDSVDDSNK